MFGPDSRLTQLLAGPIAATAIAALTALTGFLAGWLRELLTDPRGWITAEGVQYEPLGFWTLVFCTVALTLVQQVSVARVTSSAQHRITGSLKQLEDLTSRLPEILRTQPPREFLDDYGAAFEKALLSSTQPDVSVEDGLRLVLAGIATLARAFDDKAGEYTANVMIFVGSSHATAWKPHIRFPDSASLDMLRGVLVLRSDLNVKSGSDGEITINATVPQLALPIPLEADCGHSKSSGGTGWRILPGAPMVFCKTPFEHFAATSQVAEWCETQGDFAAYVKRELIEYFHQETDGIAGFLSVPVYQPTDSLLESRDRTKVGVVNVHWSDAGRLRVPESAANFAQVIYPFLALIGLHLSADRNFALNPTGADVT